MTITGHIAAAVGVLTVISAWLAVRHMVRKHGGHVVAWRFVTGADMSAGGSHECQPGRDCKAGRWAHAPRHRRAAYRLGASATSAGILAGMVTDPFALCVTLAATLTAGTAGGIVWARRGRAERQHERTVIRPLAASLARVLDVPEVEARRLVNLPAGSLKRTRGELGSVTLPRWYAASPDQRKAVDHLITSHLPAAVDTAWRTAGGPKRVVISAAPSPPDLVPWASVTSIMDGLKPGEILLGLDRRGEPYLFDLNGGDDPHAGFSVGSGRGKSTQLCSIGAQVLRKDPGATMLGIDPKMVSFEPLAGLPGVRLANDPRDIEGQWTAIHEFRTMMDARVRERHADPTAEFPFALLFIDELNAFSAMSAAAYKEMGEKGVPPVWMDIAACLWQGRFVRVHCILVGQRLDEKATGGIGLRDSLGLRALAGFRPAQYKMLIGNGPVPKSQKPRGRWLMSNGQDEVWVQNPYGTPQQLRDWAMEGGRSRPVDVPTVAGTVVSSRIDAGERDGHSGPCAVAWVVGLQAAADHLDMSLSALEKARQRRPVAGEIRKGNQPAWTADDLNQWRADAPRAGVSGK